MREIILIAARDFREVVRDGRLLWTGGLIVVLPLTALAVGWQRQAALQAERVTAQALDYEDRSEEHTSELQSLMRISYAVFCLKKKKIKHVKRLYTLYKNNIK